MWGIVLQLRSLTFTSLIELPNNAPLYYGQKRLLMPCLCFGRRSERDSLFHWPNFTFSHSQQSLHRRRIHSTFSIQEKHKHRRVLRRRDTVQSEPATSSLWKPKKSRRDVGSTDTGTARTLFPNDVRGQSNASPIRGSAECRDASKRNERHVHWAGSGGKTRMGAICIHLANA